jgi:hypothetical protein
MSDYLTNLAARALGRSVVARPRRLLFELRRGAAETPLRGGAEPEARAPEAVVDSPVREPATPEAIRERDGTAVPDGDRGPLRVAAPPRAPGRGRSRAAAALPGPAEHGAAPSAAKERRVPAAPPKPETHRPGVRTEPARPGSLRAEAPPVLAARPPRPQVPAKDAPASTVRVTIGRVDVRAVTPEQPPEQRRKPTRAPRMSLDDYLSRLGRHAR